jgi:hypothetical protein
MNLGYIGEAENIINLIDDLEHTPLHKFALQSVNLAVSKQNNETDKKTINMLTNPDGITSSDILKKINDLNPVKVNGDLNPVKVNDDLNPVEVNDDINPVKIMDKHQLSAEIKFVAYASPMGKAEGTNKKPAFMFSNFGVESIAKMFEP